VKNRLPRKLAAILCADVAGYSRLTGEDEEGTHRQLSEFLDLISNAIEEHQGRVVHYAGDAVLADFNTVTEALSCATFIQCELEIRNKELQEERKVQFRIGVNLGEVIVDRDEIYGDGVNVAARLEALADPGGICISDAVRTAIGKKLDLTYEDMGEQAVKNIEEPVRAYRVVTGTREQHDSNAVSMPGLALPDKPSIAVLPFTNMSGDPEQEYFSDGITEDIITALARIPGLLVVARHSTMIYKGKAIDVKQVGREQGVRYVLEGSVRNDGDRVRVTAQLIDAETGHHQWADRYDRNLDDIFSVQDDITQNIAVEMRVQFTLGEKARLRAGGTKSVEAWGLIVRADELNNRLIREDNLEARRLAEEAVRIDSGYASARTELGWTHWEDAYFGWTESPEQSVTEALQAAQKALELEDNYPNALALLGFVHRFKGEHELAVELTERAALLAPSDAENAAEFAHALTFAGRPDEAVEVYKRAIRLSPIYPAWYLVGLGVCYYSMNELDLAISTLREAIARDPDPSFAKIYLASALMDAGSVEDAKQLAREVMRFERNFSVETWHGVQFRDATIKEKMIDNLIKAGLPA
jgi:adenylate cyclase